MFGYSALSRNEGDTVPGGSAHLTPGAALHGAHMHRGRGKPQRSICLWTLPIIEEPKVAAGGASFLHFHIFQVWRGPERV